jgi:hypothetical protein
MRDQQGQNSHPFAAFRRTHHGAFTAEPTSAQRWRGAEPRRAGIAEYAFLIGQLIDSETLGRAIDIAHRWGVPPYKVLVALGWVER